MKDANLSQLHSNNLLLESSYSLNIIDIDLNIIDIDLSIIDIDLNIIDID